MNKVMPLQRIVSFNGNKYFQCLHSGVLTLKCYALPTKDGRKNGGSFADAACALAWMSKQVDDKKMTEKKYHEMLGKIKEELIPNYPAETQLIEAPEMVFLFFSAF